MPPLVAALHSTVTVTVVEKALPVCPPATVPVAPLTLTPRTGSASAESESVHPPSAVSPEVQDAASPLTEVLAAISSALLTV